MPSRLTALDRKLVRDLWAMRSQAAAIALVVAAGVTMFVAYFSNFESLQRTREDFYRTARFADVFAALTRAPARLEARLASLPGVAAAATRVVADVTLDVPGMDDPATGRLVSIASAAGASLNGVYLRRGRWVDPSRRDDVLASETFCEAHGFGPGDTVDALINGRRRTLTIVGVVISPEYVYGIRPGEMFPDARRFGIFWMDRRALASAYDMDGAFNDVAVALAPGASLPDVIAGVDRLLAPYGGRGVVPRSLQSSAWMLDNELAQLETFGVIIPLIFFGVAAFVLHVALTRALALQRTQVATLKALGYSNGQLAWHYVKWALAIAAAGAAAGIGVGVWLGSVFIGIYNEFFRFPALDYHLSAGVALAAMGVSLLVAALGAQAAVRRAVRVPPAEAMRPEPPARFRRSLVELPWRPLRLSFAARMVVRNLERQPARGVMSVVGIAFAVAVIFVGLSFVDVMDALIDEQFTLTMRQDATVTFTAARGPRVVHDLAHLPGVLHVEPTRTVPVRLRSATRSRTLAITGMAGDAHLARIVDRRGRAVPVPPDGLVISTMLGDVLAVRAGDTVRVDVLEGRRPSRDLVVAALVDDSVGLQAYLRLDAVARLLREGPTVSGAALAIDPAQRDRFQAAVKKTPAVAGVAMRDVALRNFRETLAEHMNVSILINVIFAGIIAFGVVYNAARVSLSERSRELASLRVLGFTRTEISLVLLGELALLTALALPLGALIGHVLGELTLAALSSEVYRMSFVATRATLAWAWLTVVAAAAFSALVVRRRLDALDLVAVLKSKE
jgi:putative ABC transport system permease protein